MSSRSSVHRALFSTCWECKAGAQRFAAIVLRGGRHLKACTVGECKGCDCEPRHAAGRLRPPLLCGPADQHRARRKKPHCTHPQRRSPRRQYLTQRLSAQIRRSSSIAVALTLIGPSNIGGPSYVGGLIQGKHTPHGRFLLSSMTSMHMHKTARCTLSAAPLHAPAP